MFIMSEIQKFGRYTDDLLQDSCNDNQSHWYFEVDLNTKCECNTTFTGSRCVNRYIFCSKMRSLSCKYFNGLTESSHSKCPKNKLIERCNKIVISEIMELYNKLRIITDYISKDCIRYIILAELGSVQRPQLNF